MTYRDLLAALQLAQLWRRKANDARQSQMNDLAVEYEQWLDQPIVEGDVEFLECQES